MSTTTAMLEPLGRVQQCSNPRMLKEKFGILGNKNICFLSEY